MYHKIVKKREEHGAHWNDNDAQAIACSRIYEHETIKKEHILKHKKNTLITYTIGKFLFVIATMFAKNNRGHVRSIVM